MARKLQSGADYPTGYLGALVHLVQVTTDTATHYFGTRAVTYDGHDYSSYLIFDSPVRRYRSLQADVAELKLANTDGVVEALLNAERFEGAKCILLEYFPDLVSPDAAELLRGVLSEQQAGEDVVSWRLIPEYDFAAIVLPERQFATTCSWRYKSPPCGSASGETSCPKDYAACVVRGATHRFNGFIQITTQLVRLYPPTPPRPPEGPHGPGGPIWRPY
jgi:phage-related protein